MKRWMRTKEEVRKDAAERLAETRSCGIKFISLLGSPNPGETCAAALALQGKRINIGSAPELPLPQCDAEHCKCLLLASE